LPSREKSCRNKTRLCVSFTRADLFLKEFQGSGESENCVLYHI
jgi:hypothetical protein